MVTERSKNEEVRNVNKYYENIETKFYHNEM